MTQIGGVKLHSGQFLTLRPQDYYYPVPGEEERPILLEITCVGKTLPNGTHILIEGFRHLDRTTLATAIAVRIDALIGALN